MIRKKILSVLVLIAISFFNFNASFSQDNTSGALPAGEQSGEISLASGGTIEAVCTGNVPFKKLTVKDGFNNVVIDPETGLLQLTIDIKKTTDKNILEFLYTILLDPQEVINKFLQGGTIQVDTDKVKLSLMSTNLVTGETIDVANEVRKLIEQDGQNTIDTIKDVPVMASLKMTTMGNLASGTLRVDFQNTNKVIDKAAEVIGEEITVSDNGQVSAIGRFNNIPINGSFENLSGLDISNLPKIINPDLLPAGIDLNNLPAKIMNITDFPSASGFGDLINIPSGFDLMDIAEIPAGFTVEDLIKIPPGFTPADLGKLPEGFNLNDFVKFPIGVNLDQLPSGFTIQDLALFPPLSSIKELPAGVTPQDLKNLPLGIKLSDLANLNPNDPNAANIVCENGIIKPGLQPFMPPGISSNICSMPPSGPTGPDGSTDTSAICENGMIKPGFESFVPAGFDCSLVQ
ncbi:MAG: hypothetical protein A3B68_05095 [Candidatus Melainabacteria bacterium RIFCSPHIGHO2_02_FULL_34_12]|nr:MAG: hypothetical protein A3B68_05095 [Candidatus Melainabacteria bacterium RIFCSPHIGHO2_02_FULL_34_12]